MDNEILKPFTRWMEKGLNDEMSEICIGIIHIKDKQGKADVQMMKKEALNMALNFKFELGWSLQYRENFITNKNLLKSIVFDLTRKGVAETILCPDWCRYNGWENDEELRERLVNIVAILGRALEISDYIDWYIGESGGEEEDYDLYNVNIIGLADLVIKLYNQYGDVPNAHFYITK